MADSAIPMGFRPAQIQEPDLVGAIGRGMSLQQMAQTTQLNQQRIKEETLKAQNMDEDRQDEATIQASYLKNGGDWDKMRAEIAPKVRTRNLQRADADHLTAQRNVLAMDNDKRMKLDLDNKLTGQEAAGMLELPYEARKAELPAALSRLQTAGIDVSQYANIDPTDQNLKAIAAHSSYLGNVLSYAEKKAKEEQLKAAADRATQQAVKLAGEEDRKAIQQKMEDAARDHLAVTNQAEHDEWLKNLDPDVAKRFGNLKQFNDGTQNAIQRMGMNSVQRSQADSRDQTADLRAQAERDRAAGQRDTLQFRRDAQEQNAALRELAISLSGKRTGTMTPKERGVEERNIAALEDGTPKQQGLNQRRAMIGVALSKGKETVKGNETDLTPTRRAELEAEYKAVSNSLQNTQYRKAQLYGVAAPNQEDVSAADDNTEIAAPDGSVWKKSGGVAFYKGSGTAAPAPTSGAPAASTAPATAPAPKAESSPQKMTEADARAKAKAAGKDENWYVNELRKKNLLQ